MDKTSKVVIAIALIILIMWKINHESNNNRINSAEAAYQRDMASGASNEESVLVTEVIQEYHGVAASDIDDDFIKMVEDHLLKKGEEVYAAAMKDMGQAPKVSGMTAASIRINEGGENLVISTFSGGSETKIAWWILGNQLRRVSCISRGGQPITLRHGKCGRQIEKTFGYHGWVVD